MKESLITILRNTHTSRHLFRETTEKISFLLAGESGGFLTEESITVETPLQPAPGKLLNEKVVIIPILRAGLAMLPAFLRFYPDASVGFFGMRRDEKTKEPNLYYENLPKITASHNVIVIDPMLATGGSGTLALSKVLEHGVPAEQIIYVSIIAAPEGVETIKKAAPGIHLLVAKVDEKLNQDAFIVPGIGDFGDRYFGTDE